MKPIAEKIDRRSEGDVSSNCKRLPLVDCNYQTFSLGRCYGGPAGNSPGSFLNISRDYFQREAAKLPRRDRVLFRHGCDLAGAFVEGARAIIHFLHLPAA